MRKTGNLGRSGPGLSNLCLLVVCCTFSVATGLQSLAAPKAQSCNWAAFDHLSRAEMRAHLAHFQPLQPPCCGKGLNLAGSVELRVAFDTQGKVVCAEVTKGHPLAAQSAMQSVRQWRFRPYKIGGRFHAAFGPIVVRYRLVDHGSTSQIE
jgi:hypothetical protein